jgi:hypothetical protein
VISALVPAEAAAWKKDGFEFLYFAAKTVGRGVEKGWLRNGEVCTENRKSVVVD